MRIVAVDGTRVRVQDLEAFDGPRSWTSVAETCLGLDPAQAEAELAQEA